MPVGKGIYAVELGQIVAQFAGCKALQRRRVTADNNIHAWAGFFRYLSPSQTQRQPEYEIQTQANLLHAIAHTE